MPSPFELASAIERTSENVYSSVIPEGFQQGRGAFGGLVLGTLARAMIASEPDETRLLKMLSGEICGPVLVGPTRIEVSVLRRGKNLTSLDARLLQNGEVLARASAGLSTPRATSGDVRSPDAPKQPRVEDTKRSTVGSGIEPPFARHYAYSPTGPLPFSGGTDPRVEGYVREAVAPTRVDGPTVIALLDAYWPALFSVTTTPRAAATVGFTAQILVDPRTLDPETPLFHRGVMTAMRDGFFIEMRELWLGETLVGMNQQTFALLA
jgi:hypothetical protein